MRKNDYVWYASYGSNINRDRFLCYILGGTPKGSTKEESGCEDPSLPIDERSLVMQHQLYFARTSERWQGGGVAFIDIERDPGVQTHSKMYLITKEQFRDVVRQENDHLNGLEFDLEEVKKKGSLTFLQSAWYGKMIYLGTMQGSPIFTFTATSTMDSYEIKAPSFNYLETILRGLKKELGLTHDQIIDYIKEVPGVQHNYSTDDLKQLKL